MTEKSTLRRIGSLEINQDLELERRFTIIQRIGWIAIALGVFAGLLGLLGPGPLNDRIAGRQGSALWVEYPRFGRFQAPVRLRVYVHQAARATQTVDVWLNRDYLQDLQLKQMVPEPIRTALGPDRVIFSFALSEGTQDASFDFTFEPEEIGSFHGIVGIEGGPQVELNQFIYP